MTTAKIFLITVIAFSMAAKHTSMRRYGSDSPFPPDPAGDMSPQCKAVNNTKCDGTNEGSCRMDCGMKEMITESECYERGCCWNVAADGEKGTPVAGLPWCFFPGGNAECSLAQAAKDNDPAIKAAALAYHESGDFTTADAYRKACLSRGEHFYSWYLTPETWYDVNGDYNWKSTKVSLVKYGCVAAKCSTATEIERMMTQIGAEQNRDQYPSGDHASLKFNVTGYSYVTKDDKPDTPVGPGPAPVKDEGMGAMGAIALAALSIMLVGTTGMALHFYRQLPESQEGILDRIYVRKDSFPAMPEDPPQKPAHSATPALNSPRDSLLNSAV